MQKIVFLHYFMLFLNHNKRGLMSTQTVNLQLFSKIISQRGIPEMAYLCHVSPRTIEKIRKGYVPSSSVQRRLRDGLNIAIEDLFPLEDHEPQAA